MRRLTMPVIISITILLVSCGETEHPETATNDKPNRGTDFAQLVFEHVGDEFYAGKPAFTQEDWDKMEKLLNDIVDLRERTKGNIVAKDSLNVVFSQYGYDSYEEGRQAVREIARLQGLMMDLSLQASTIQAKKMTGDDEEAEEARKQVTENLKNRKLTSKDIISIDQNSHIIGRAVASQMIITYAE